MATIKEIKENLNVISAIKNITGTYQEIANLKMNQIREKVLKNREFFGEILNTHQRIKSAYIISLKKGWLKKEKKSFRQTEKEKAIIFLSANQFFYGTLILDIWKELEEYLKKNKADLIVVGRTGKYLAEKSGFGHKMFYFELNDTDPEEKTIKEIIELVKNYQKIIVFHGKYEKVLFQNPAISDISGELPFEKKENVESYLFEPSAESILEFFETEIIAVLFNQTILEHQLARYASRVMAMHQAAENAKNMEKSLIMAQNKLKRQKLNKKQIEFFGNIYAGIR